MLEVSDLCASMYQILKRFVSAWNPVHWGWGLVLILTASSWSLLNKFSTTVSELESDYKSWFLVLSILSSQSLFIIFEKSIAWALNGYKPHFSEFWGYVA